MRSPQRMILTVLGVGTVLAAACQSSSIFSPRDFSLLAQAEARWRARPFADYSFEIKVVCFCPPEINRWTRVSVRNGAVVDAQAVEPDPNFPGSPLSYWQPIDSLFTNMFRAMKESAAASYLEAIVVDYDPQLGYPRSIEYRPKSNIADGGATYSLRNVVPLP